MKKVVSRLLLLVAFASMTSSAYAQFNIRKAIGGAVKAVKAFTLTDAQMAAYVKGSVAAMDSKNSVLPEDNAYTQRLRKLTEGITDAES